MPDRPTLRRRLSKGDTTFGAWIQTASPTVAEILADQDFDWITIDCEHGIIDLAQIATLTAAIQSRNKPALVRLPGCDDIWIRRVLDTGVDGIIVPMVNTPEIARHAASWAKYPPLGKRGFGFSRANGYGERFDEYAASANDKVTVIAQIEHIDAVNQIDEIVSTEGIDGFFIGPYDLSGSMGLVGQTQHPDVLAQCDKVLQACIKHRKPAGIHIVSADPEEAKPFIKKGFKIIALGIDTLFLRHTARQMLSGVKALR